MKTAIVKEQCPYCRVPFARMDESIAPAAPWPMAAVAICHQCGHLFAGGVDDGVIFGAGFDYDWLHDNFTDEDRRAAREYQEDIHRKNGHWG